MPGPPACLPAIIRRLAVCHLLRTGVAAIFGPQSSHTASHVQSICDTMEVKSGKLVFWLCSLALWKNYRVRHPIRILLGIMTVTFYHRNYHYCCCCSSSSLCHRYYCFCYASCLFYIFHFSLHTLASKKKNLAQKKERQRSVTNKSK